MRDLGTLTGKQQIVVIALIVLFVVLSAIGGGSESTDLIGRFAD